METLHILPQHTRRKNPVLANGKVRNDFLTLVAISLLIATVSSYTALDLAGRIRTSSGWAKHAWLATAALAMGGGMWAMHFVAMLALTIPNVQVAYGITLTILSFVLPVVISGISLFVLSRTSAGPGNAYRGRDQEPL